eukprot:g17406.t1
MVVDSLQSKHFPDRTKLGLLWGVEEMMGHWLQGASSLASVGAPTSGAAQRAPPTIPVRADVFLLETTGQMRLAEMPQSIETAGNSPTACWAARQLPGVEEAAMRVVELIRTFDILELNKRLEKSTGSGEGKSTGCLQQREPFSSRSPSAKRFAAAHGTHCPRPKAISRTCHRFPPEHSSFRAYGGSRHFAGKRRFRGDRPRAASCQNVPAFEAKSTWRGLGGHITRD